MKTAKPKNDTGAEPPATPPKEPETHVAAPPAAPASPPPEESAPVERSPKKAPEAPPAPSPGVSATAETKPEPRYGRVGLFRFKLGEHRPRR